MKTRIIIWAVVDTDQDILIADAISKVVDAVEAVDCVGHAFGGVDEDQEMDDDISKGES